MKNKIILALIIALMWSGVGYSDIVSLDSNYVPGATDVITKLNNDRTALTNGVNNIEGVSSGTTQTAGQVKAGTIGEENMADDANPRIYIDELFINGKLESNNGVIGVLNTDTSAGLDFATSGNLTASASAGVAYTRGYRVEKASSTANTFTANKWTYAFICQTGAFDYVERNVGVALNTDEYPDGCQPLSRVSTDATAVIAVQDLRRLKLVQTSYDSVFDESTESSMKDLLVANGSSYRAGAILKYNTVSSFTVTAGSAMINGQARDRIEVDSDASWGVASTSADDGLDTGTRSTGTYYVYLVADEEDQRGYTVVWSTNSSAPSGKTNYMKVGEFYTEGGTISSDSVKTYIWEEDILPSKEQVVKAWLVFNGNSNTFIDSYNISSVADNGTGNYTIAFNQDFDNANYAWSGSAQADSSGSSTRLFVSQNNGDTKSSSALQVRVVSDANTPFDTPVLSVIALGDR